MPSLHNPPLSEADTRSKLIDPAIHARGWTEEHIRREETAGAIEIIDGKPRRRSKGRVDYTLRVKVSSGPQPVPLAVIEAKSEDLPPTHGLEQAKSYARCKRLNVPFAFSSNGHLFVEFDRFTGLTTAPRPMAEFPTCDGRRARYEAYMGFQLNDEVARPLVTPYAGGEAKRRYYQDAAIRAVFEKVAKAEKDGQPKRALLSLATGAGKTFIVLQIRAFADQLLPDGRSGHADRHSDRKLMFRIYDYTGATNLFGQKFVSPPPPEPPEGPPGPDGPHPPPPPQPRIIVQGFNVTVTEAGHSIPVEVDGVMTKISVEEYKERLARRLIEEAANIGNFRGLWIVRNKRLELFGRLPDAGRSPLLVRALAKMDDYDLYDVLADLGYGLDAKTRIERADAFTYKHAAWLSELPQPAARTLEAIVGQFGKAGTDGLESPDIFNTPEVRKAGGKDGPIKALRELGKPADVLQDTKARLFAA